MKNQKIITVVMRGILLIVLTVLSKHPFEISILFGSVYLLRWQAGGFIFQGYKRLAAILIFWIMGKVSYSLVCPNWVLYPFLLLINMTIFFFAPATNATTTEEKIWKRHFLSSKELQLLKKRQEYRYERKQRAIFITVLLSFLVVIRKGTPVSSLLLVSLLAETISILLVIWESLQKEPWEM